MENSQSSLARYSLSVICKYLSSHLGLLAKVEKQPNFHFCCFEIIDELQFMFFNNRLRSFQFQHDKVVDHNVSKVVAYFITLVVNFDWKLTSQLEAIRDEFLHHRPFIYLLQKTVTQGVIHLIETSDNSFSDILMKVVHDSALFGNTDNTDDTDFHGVFFSFCGDLLFQCHLCSNLLHIHPNQHHDKYCEPRYCVDLEECKLNIFGFLLFEIQKVSR